MYASARVADLYPATIGERVAAERARAGLSVEETVGDGEVLDAAMLHSIEDGSAQPLDLSHLLWLSWQFECPLSAILSSPLRERALVSYHGDRPDMAIVDQLVEYLELSEHLDDFGVARPA
jgi:hypothetical protein